MAQGVTLLFVSGGSYTAFGPGGLVTLPATGLGAYKLASGYSTVRRGSLQIGESLNDPSGPALTNLWGLVPWGQKFDDPVEPGPIGYLNGLRLQDPFEVIATALRDYFVY